MEPNANKVYGTANLAWSALYELSQKYGVTIKGMLIFSSNEEDKNLRTETTQQINIIA